jgi:hypothetical protein
MSLMAVTANSPCPLCHGETTLFLADIQVNKKYFRCKICDLHFLDPTLRPTQKQQLDRYQLHASGQGDPKYIQFIAPLIKKLKANIHSPAKGLDFGCGRNPVLQNLLSDQYKLTNYDPLFFPQTVALENRYDFILAIEVAEHFFSPDQDFLILRNMLKTNGALGIMTSLLVDSIDFKDWYYRRDPTHVCFYTETTIAWICKKYEFASVEIINDNTIWFTTENS